MRALHIAFVALLALGSVACRGSKSSSGSKVLVWNTSADWSPEAEAEFSKFVQRIGDARWAHNLADRPADLAAWKAFIGYDPGECIFLKDCIKNPKVNPLYKDEDKALTIEADCGDVPGILRAYFAYKKKIPYIYEWSTANPEKDHGIFPPTIIYSQSSLKTMNQLFTDIRDHQHAHFYRTPINVEHTDTYPVRIGRDTIKPGTVAYFVGGHAMMVFRIKPDGTVMVIQGHPGEPNGIPPSYFSVTTINETTLPQDFYYKSGGFRNWRPYVRSNQKRFSQQGITYNGVNIPPVVYNDSDGIVFAPNKDIPDLDRDLTNFQSTYSLPNGKTGNFYDYLKSQLCNPSVCGKRKPSELRDMIFGICTTLKERQERVASAVKAGLTKAAHPGIPADVYNAENPWEAQSTPGFDGRVRAAFIMAVNYMRDTANDLSAGTKDIDFNGSRADLLNTYQGYIDEANASKECQVTVDGETGDYSLTLKQVNEKLYDLSFDPYHCPELRWGIQADCRENQKKFYAEEAGIRNVSKPGERPSPNGMGANGLPKQLDAGPDAPPAIAERNLQAALDALKGSTVVVNTPVPTAGPQPRPTTAPTTRPTTAPTVAPTPVPVLNTTEETLKFVQGTNFIQMNVRTARTYLASQLITISGKANDTTEVKQVVLREGTTQIIKSYTRIGAATFSLNFTIAQPGTHKIDVYGIAYDNAETKYGEITLIIK